jgi:site-specific DNA-methyltransferase (adenine-specific)
MNPYYQDESVTLYHADNREVLPGLAGGGFDLVFTSPPYNVGASPGGNGRGLYPPSRGGRSATKWKGFSGYGTHTDDLSMEEYAAWQTAVLGWCWAALAERGAIFYNHKPRIIFGRLWMPTVLGEALPLRQIITWDGSRGFGLGDRHFCPAAEWILLYAREAFALRDRKASALTDIWRIPSEKQKLGHPAPFPVALPATAIEATAATRVLDPHAGVGSTLVAAKRAGAKAVGIKIEERFCEIAARRLSQGVLALFGEAVA